METKLVRISQLSKENPDMVFKFQLSGSDPIKKCIIEKADKLSAYLIK